MGTNKPEVKKCSRCGYNNHITHRYTFTLKPLCESCAKNESKIGIMIESIST